jgi:hypothetical protein
MTENHSYEPEELDYLLLFSKSPGGCDRPYQKNSAVCGKYA